MPCRILLVALLAVSSARAGTIIHVDVSNCPGPGDGSEVDPYCSIQAAIRNAVNGDEILVAPGTYFEAIDFLGKAITVAASDGPDATILDGTGHLHVVQCVTGEQSGTVLQGFTITGGNANGSHPDNRGGGMRNIGSSPTVIDCRFVANAASASGAGMYNEDGMPTIAGCAFIANAAAISGGGMCNVESDPVLSGCLFSLNTTGGGSGGGLFNTGLCGCSGSDATLTNCTFDANTAAGIGGGMSNGNSSNSVLTGCTFINNHSGNNSGGLSNSGTILLTDCTFSNNTASFGAAVGNSGDLAAHHSTFEANAASASGGALYSSAAFSAATATFEHCTFRSNHGGTTGGAIRSSSGDAALAVTDCVFIDNGLDSPVGDGGAIYADGSLGVRNSLFLGNAAGDQGGAVYTLADEASIINCTFSQNLAGEGGAICTIFIGVTSVHNCICWGDQPPEIADASGGVTTVTYSDVHGGWPGPGNIDADPHFADAGAGDFNLAPGSPAIDAGDNLAVPGGVVTDLDERPRFLEIPETPDTGNGTLPIVDMGAYESLGGGCLAVTAQEVACHADGTTFTVNVEGLNACTGGTTQVSYTASGGAAGQDLCFTALINDGGFCCSTEICVAIPDCSDAVVPFDLDDDGQVGVTDFIALLAGWGACSTCGACPADFNDDCSVDAIDMMQLLDSWG